MYKYKKGQKRKDMGRLSSLPESDLRESKCKLQNVDLQLAKIVLMKRRNNVYTGPDQSQVLSHASLQS